MGVSSAGVTAFQDVQERIRARERERLAATARESGDQIAALRQQLEHERRFRDETGQLIEMPLHVKLGGGAGQDNHLRIHFAWSSDYAQILVGHIGRHLRTARS